MTEGSPSPASADSAPSACARFRERSLACDPAIAFDPHLSTCSDPICRQAADDAGVVRDALIGWRGSDVPAVNVADIQRAVRLSRRATADGKSRATNVAAALATVAAALLVGFVVSLAPDALSPKQVADPNVIAQRDLPPSTPGVVEPAPVRLMTVSTRPAELWMTRQVEPLVVWPVKLSERDLWADLSQSLPANWRDGFAWPDLPDTKADQPIEVEPVGGDSSSYRSRPAFRLFG